VILQLPYHQIDPRKRRNGATFPLSQRGQQLATAVASCVGIVLGIRESLASMRGVSTTSSPTLHLAFRPGQTTPAPVAPPPLLRGTFGNR